MSAGSKTNISAVRPFWESPQPARSGLEPESFIAAIGSPGFIRDWTEVQSKVQSPLSRTLHVPFRITVLPNDESVPEKGSKRPRPSQWMFMNIVMMPEYQEHSPEVSCDLEYAHEMTSQLIAFFRNCVGTTIR